MTTQRWTEVLDEIEARIASTEAALDAEDILLDTFQDAFVAPSDLGPLPSTLRDRAIDVLRRQSETEQRLNETIDSMRREISKATRQRGATEKANVYREGPISQFFDSNV